MPPPTPITPRPGNTTPITSPEDASRQVLRRLANIAKQAAEAHALFSQIQPLTGKKEEDYQKRLVESEKLLNEQIEMLTYTQNKLQDAEQQLQDLKNTSTKNTTTKGHEHTAAVTELQRHRNKVKALEAEVASLKAEVKSLTRGSGRFSHEFEITKSAQLEKELEELKKNIEEGSAQLSSQPSGPFPANQTEFRDDAKRRHNRLRRDIRDIIQTFYDLDKVPPTKADASIAIEEPGRSTTMNWGLPWFDTWDWARRLPVDRERLVMGSMYDILHDRFLSQPLFGFQEWDPPGERMGAANEDCLRRYEAFLHERNVRPVTIADWVRVTINAAEELGQDYTHASLSHTEMAAKYMFAFFYPILKSPRDETRNETVLSRLRGLCNNAVALVLKLRKAKDKWVFFTANDYLDSFDAIPYDSDKIFNRSGILGEKEFYADVAGSEIAFQIFGGLVYYERREDGTQQFDDEWHVKSKSRVIVTREEQGSKRDNEDEEGGDRKRTKTDT